MSINYKKNNNLELFSKLNNENIVDVSNIQNYIPLYNLFFNLNENNYNSINLNNYNKLSNIIEKITYSKYNSYISDICNNITQKKIFIKFSPLIDPIKYMIGKYDNSVNILQLPKLYNNNEDISDVNKLIDKINDTNNSAYIDGFFSYLSSILLNNYNFKNGIDFYGSFIGIKNNFQVNIEDDIEYLDKSDYFHKYYQDKFKFIDLKHTNIFNNTKKFKKKIYFDNNEKEEEIYLDIINIDNNKFDKNSFENIEYISDIINVEENMIINKNNENNEDNISESSCSSRYSSTNFSENSDSNNTNDIESISGDSQSSEEEEDIIINIDKFPVELIILECCEDTLDSYIVNNKIKDKEWESIVLQILFTLITYQKAFNFTHNDLHTNNIVYINTDKKYLYYKYNNKHYKVPTFGKIYKIIDFGRGIYKFKNNIMCSDSYSKEGDANTQYNCEPYLNENKPRLDPNYSFDLCRLGCSIFDYFIDDIDDIKKLKSPIKKIIVSWIFDDNNKNILYKNNGEERYPDFKLYKMIARTVHNHTPQKVLSNILFDDYIIAKKKINNSGSIFNIDELPIMV